MIKKIAAFFIVFSMTSVLQGIKKGYRLVPFVDTYTAQQQNDTQKIIIRKNSLSEELYL